MQVGRTATDKTGTTYTGHHVCLRHTGDPYKELQELLLRSYGLSAEQMTSKWLDYPMCGDTRPSVLWDNLTALQPAMVKDAQTVLFICKLPSHIRNLINPRAFKTPKELIQCCNELWATSTSTQVAPPPCSPTLGGWTRRSTASPKKNSSPWRKQVLFATQIRPGRPRCIWSPRKMGLGAPAATTAA
jgi:hypothetical protein